MKISTIGVDIAKSVFYVHAVDGETGEVLRRKLGRRALARFFERLEPCVVGMEACGTSHYWGRLLQGLGHDVRLIPPAHVKPYVKRGQKNDAADAAAICEAVSRPGMWFVPVKTAEQQSLASLHRVRDRLIRTRTGHVNALRSQMAEVGVIAPRGRRGIWELSVLLRSGDDRIAAILRAALLELVEAIEDLTPRIDQLESMIVAAAKSDAMARLLMTIPGIGPITASALSALVGDVSRFRNARHFAAWLGLTPRQNSTGGKTRLGGITKMGDRYLRKLLVLGARSGLRTAKTAQTPLAAWTRRLLARRRPRQVSVALANKTARIAWAVMATSRPYRAELAARAA